MENGKHETAVATALSEIFQRGSDPTNETCLRCGKHISKHFGLNDYRCNPKPDMPPEKRKDLKEALGSARKADLTHIRTAFMNYGARACEYGNVKYERSNYLREVGGTGKNFERLRAYLRAAASHIFAVLDSMEAHQANDPNLLDEEGMKKAAYCEDTDSTPGAKVGASGLPHLCGAVASLMMAITQATVYGLLPKDPGCPWERKQG